MDGTTDYEYLDYIVKLREFQQYLELEKPDLYEKFREKYKEVLEDFNELRKRRDEGRDLETLQVAIDALRLRAASVVADIQNAM
jgi:hypothetical protein